MPSIPAPFLDPVLPLVPVVAAGPCALCGVAAAEVFATGFDYEIRTCRNPWAFVRCPECGHVQLDPRPAPEALGTIYPSTYYAYNYETQVNHVARRAKAWLDRVKFRGILRHLARPAAGYLDVGCGDGRFLDLMAARGVPRTRIWGLELDAATVARVRARGFQGVHARVEDCDAISAGTLDLATMFHVIEHVADPSRVVDRLAGWLAPGGVLALETPNLDSLDARIFREHWWGGYHFPRHWHLFTPVTISRLLRDAGFEVQAIRYQTGHSFWLYSFHHRLRYGQPPHPRLAARFNPLGGSLLALAAVTAFDKCRAALGARTSAMLVIARRR